MDLFDNDGTTYDSALFDVTQDPRLKAPAPTAKPSRTAAEHRKVARRIGNGTHPLGHPIYLHADAPRDLDSREAQASTSTGPRCGSCVFRVKYGAYPKCLLPTKIGDRDTYPRASGSESSDIAAWWPACTDYQRVKP